MEIGVSLDEGLCCGFGNCALVCPDVFEVDPATNRSRLLRAAADAVLAPRVEQAAAECPAQAIILFEAGLTAP